METVGIMLVLLSGVLHSAWNIMCKAKSPSGAFFFIATAVTVIACLPVPFLIRTDWSLLNLNFWYIIIGTGIANAVYYVALGNAYRVTEVSIAYPLIRAIPVLMIPAVTSLLHIGGRLSSMAVFAMVIVAAGCVIISLPPLKTLHIRDYMKFGYLFILLSAGGKVGFTIIDKAGMDMLNSSGAVEGQVQQALFYLFVQNISILVFISIYICSMKFERVTLKEICRSHVHYPILAGLICNGAYTLVLIAMLYTTNASYVMAFLQIGIPISAVSGMIIFKEKATAKKITGICILCAGLVLLALFKSSH